MGPYRSGGWLQMYPIMDRMAQLVRKESIPNTTIRWDPLSTLKFKVCFIFQKQDLATTTPDPN